VLVDASVATVSLAPVDSPPVVISVPLVVPVPDPVLAEAVPAVDSVLTAVLLPAVCDAPDSLVASADDSVSSGVGVPHAPPSPTTTAKRAARGNVNRREFSACERMSESWAWTMGTGSSPLPRVSTDLSSRPPNPLPRGHDRALDNMSIKPGCFDELGGSEVGERVDQHARRYVRRPTHRRGRASRCEVDGWTREADRDASTRARTNKINCPRGQDRGGRTTARRWVSRGTQSPELPQTAHRPLVPSGDGQVDYPGASSVSLRVREGIPAMMAMAFGERLSVVVRHLDACR